MNVLVFGAHPDDLELGCGGTLLKHVKAGNKIYLCVMCQGHVADDPEIRKKEAEEAAKRLGATELIWGGWQDTEFQVTKGAVKFIEEVVEKTRPYEIYVNYDKDSHQDHRVLAQCVVAGTRFNKRILYYESVTSLNFQPDIFVDIDAVLEDKLHVMEAFKSQITRNVPSGRQMLDGVKAMAGFRGFQAKVHYAEGFKAFRYHKLDF